jgi:uncharacterized protein DUF3383
MAGADHSNTITINVFLGPSPPTRAGFGTALFLVNQDDGNSLNGQRVAVFSSGAEAEAANIAGYISAETLAALQAGFSQRPTPARIKVAYRDTGANETIAAAIAAIEAIDTDWYGIAQYSRVDTDIVALSTLIETRNKIYIAQSSDASLKDAALPAGLAALDGRENTDVVYHSSDAEPMDLAWLVSRLVFDPDIASAGWSGRVRGVLPVAALTTAQRDALRANNVNVGLRFSSAPVYVSPGINMAGRGIYEIVSSHWYAARVAEDIAFLKLQHSDRGEKIIVDSTGQVKILAILSGRLLQGENVGHFPKGETEATGEPIDLADTLARRLRFKVRGQIAADAVDFVVNVFLQPDPLQQQAA